MSATEPEADGTSDVAGLSAGWDDRSDFGAGLVCTTDERPDALTEALGLFTGVAAGLDRGVETRCGCGWGGDSSRRSAAIRK